MKFSFSKIVCDGYVDQNLACEAVFVQVWSTAAPMKIRLLLGFLLLPTALMGGESADVVIYGGTSGGITAAIQTARMEKRRSSSSPLNFWAG